jgi:LysR family transcriptional regulator, benzoate and cis,cis-muconate-responsive activator of ben and cat genes
MNRSIDIRQLRYFIAVAQERSFRLAAERLHITQPPLSRQIAELEAALGLRLLTRDTRHVVPTAAGELALREFTRLVERFDQVLAQVAAAATALPRLRLAMLYWHRMQGLAGFERELVQAGAISGLEVTTLTSHESVARIRQGQLDAALVVAPIAAPGAQVHRLGTLRHAAFIPARHPLARKRRLHLADLAQVPPFFRFRRSANPLLYDHFARQYAALGFAPQQAPAMEALGVFAQIAAGRGCTIMPEAMLRQRHEGMVGRPLVEDVTIDLALAVSARLPAPLRDALLRAARHLAPTASSRVAATRRSGAVALRGRAASPAAVRR